MPKKRCPVCDSANTAIGVAEWSSNVSLICNACNYRGILFYGESRFDAHRYCDEISSAHRRQISRRDRRAKSRRFRVDATHGSLGVSLSRLWAFERRNREISQRCGLALLPLVRERVGGLGRSLRYPGLEFATLVATEFCKL